MYVSLAYITTLSNSVLASTIDIPEPTPTPTPTPTPEPTPTPANSPILDVDGSGQASFARDGLLTSAFLFFYTPDRTDYSVLDKFILDTAATRKTGNDIANFLKDKITNLDADGSGQSSFARDGLLISAFLFFYTPDRTDYSVLDKFILDTAATRKTGNDIAEYLKGLLVSPANSASRASVEDLPTTFNSILGTIGDDILLGDTANNIIVGGAGNDIMTGGEGRDTFSLSFDSGSDKITDFNPAEDLIQLDRSFGFVDSNEILVAITDRGSYTELILGEKTQLIIEMDPAALDFIPNMPLTPDNFVVI